MAKLKYAFLIGRFQPLHNGHTYLIDYGLKYAENVIVLVGGANKARSIKNPWTFAERKQMIKSAYHTRVIVEQLHDVPGNDDAWLSNVYDAVTAYAAPDEIGIIGFKKDDSSYYIDLFPKAEKIILEEGFATLSATNIRDAYFQEAPRFPAHLVPDAVLDFLIDFYKTPEFKYVLDEEQELTRYHKQWGSGPFVTCDAVCTQMGHILLVTRKNFPGKGQLALPGGFVEAKKGDSFQNVLCELYEEAGITDNRGVIPKGVLKGFYTGHERRFDDPARSVRGFTLTTAFRFKFPDGKRLFTVKGGDDALDANWFPLSFVKQNPHLLFEDHAHIINKMCTISI